jgi:ABC-type multidrug transport system ATPase subunit
LPGDLHAGVAPVLEASGIEKTYRRGVWPARHRVPVLRGADLTLWPAEVVGLVGENGSGKSTLMKILVGALAPDAGTVTWSGRLGYCPQQPVVYERLTCDEHFELFGRAYRMDPAAERRSRRSLYASWGSSGTRRPAPTSSPAALWRSSIWVWPCSPTLRCCCWMSPTPGSTGTPI